MSGRVLAAVDDIFFKAKIRGAAEHLGVEIEFARDTDACVEAARQNPPAVVIADLHAERCDPFAIAGHFKSDARLSSVPLVGFYSHVQTELGRRAQLAGFDQVLPRSAFVQRLPALLRGE
ncbi:MAG: response regulator [Acidobacteria bacterium]|nr:response regulator [Acidobacteriota bacterium]